MRRLISVETLLFVSSLAAAAHAGTYSNLQFGYAIRYPSSLLQPTAAGGGAGQAFASVSGHAGFRVFAVSRKGRSPQELADDAQSICPDRRPLYRVAKSTLVAISCKIGDRIVYQKSLLRGDLAITVRGEYPAAERSIWDPVVTSISRSMSAVPRVRDNPG